MVDPVAAVISSVVPRLGFVFQVHVEDFLGLYTRFLADVWADRKDVTVTSVYVVEDLVESAWYSGAWDWMDLAGLGPAVRDLLSRPENTGLRDVYAEKTRRAVVAAIFANLTGLDACTFSDGNR